jgi:F0F1-type ATP synthase membrane subunit b/b'
MQLAPDYTIVIQVALFVAFWIVFKALVVGPTAQVLEERHHRTIRAAEDAEQLAAAAEADRARYDQKLLEQRHQMAQEAEAARHAAIAASNEEVAAARAKIALDLAHRRDQVARQVEEARRALASEAEQVATEMLARVSREGTA